MIVKELRSGPSDYPGATTPDQNMTFDKIYESYTSAGYTFIVPFFDMRGDLQKLVFTKPACAICTGRGNQAPPDFWTDLEPPQKKNETFLQK